MHEESGRTAKIRGSEHQQDLKTKKISNLWEHYMTEHRGVLAEFEYKVDR